MITSLAQYITGILLKNNVIENEYLDIYIYGFEVLISGVLSIFIGLILGLIFSQLVECIIFLIVFVTLRKYCGGYHADTYLKCNTIFAVNVAIVMIILKFNFTYHFVIHIAICVLCISIYLMLSPVENIYKPITDEEKKKYRLIAVLLAFAMIIISSLVYFCFIKSAIVMDMAMLSVAVSMLIEKLKKGGSFHEKHQEIGS